MILFKKWYVYYSSFAIALSISIVSVIIDQPPNKKLHLSHKFQAKDFKENQRCLLPEIKLPFIFSFDLKMYRFNIDSTLAKYNLKRVTSCSSFLFSQKTNDFLEKSNLGYAHTPQEEKLNASPFGIIRNFPPYTIVAFGYDYSNELTHQRIEFQVFNDSKHITDKLIVADLGTGECYLDRKFSLSKDGKLNIEINSGCWDIENDTLAEEHKYELVFQFNTKTGRFDKQQYRYTKIK